MPTHDKSHSSYTTAYFKNLWSQLTFCRYYKFSGLARVAGGFRERGERRSREWNTACVAGGIREWVSGGDAIFSRGWICARRIRIASEIPGGNKAEFQLFDPSPILSRLRLRLRIGAGMAQWWERSPPINVSRVRFTRIRRLMWVEFVVGSLPCSERFSPGSGSSIRLSPIRESFI